jgi:hypothetical protein
MGNDQKRPPPTHSTHTTVMSPGLTAAVWHLASSASLVKVCRACHLKSAPTGQVHPTSLPAIRVHSASLPVVRACRSSSFTLHKSTGCAGLSPLTIFHKSTGCAGLSPLTISHKSTGCTGLPFTTFHLSQVPIVQTILNYKHLILVKNF